MESWSEGVVTGKVSLFIKKEALVTVSWRYLPLEWGFLPRKNAEGKTNSIAQVAGRPVRESTVWTTWT